MTSPERDDVPDASIDSEVEALMSELPTVAAERAALEEEAGGASDADATQLAPDPTMVRPPVDPDAVPRADEERFVVRRTRDYDHDAQSTNRVRGAADLDTIRERRSARDLWRDPYARSARKGTVPGEGNSRSRLRPLLAMLLVAAVLGGGGAVLTYGMELWGGHAVPSVVGEPQSRAEERIAGKKLTVRVEAEPADDAIGKVLSQSPDAGTRLPEGDEVTIVVATNRVIPEVVGMSEEDARAVLREAGAESVEVVTQPSSEVEGTVIAVSPDTGQPFLSRAAVTLTVAGPYRVPDVIGKKESDAVDALEAAGLVADVTYVSAEETVRTVVETLPVAGEIVPEGGTVTVRVSSPYPRSASHLAEYFDHSSQDIDTYLQKEGYSFDKGIIDTLGNAVARYASSEKGDITFSSQPYQRSFTLPKEGTSNVLATGAPIAGIRWDVPSEQVPAQADRASVEAFAKDCELTGLTEFCDETTMTLPAGTTRVSVPFACASGEMDGLAWTVLVVRGNGVERASVTCAKQDLYTPSDLALFGGKLCQYVAYQEVYQSGDFTSKEEKKGGQEGGKKDGHAETAQGGQSGEDDGHGND